MVSNCVHNSTLSLLIKLIIILYNVALHLFKVLNEIKSLLSNFKKRLKMFCVFQTDAISIKNIISSELKFQEKCSKAHC